MAEKTTICAWVSTEVKEELEELLTEDETLSEAARAAIHTEIKLRRRAIQDYEARQAQATPQEEDVSRET